MKFRSFLFSGGIAALLGAGLFVGANAQAQIDPQFESYGLYEGGILVGELFREDTDTSRYSEHWVLYPNYVSPSEENGLTLTIRPGLAEYRNLEDFFARVPFEKGSRYIESACADGNTLPGR